MLETAARIGTTHNSAAPDVVSHSHSGSPVPIIGSLSAVATATCTMFCQPLGQTNYPDTFHSLSQNMSGHPEWMHDWPNTMPWARPQSLPESIVRFTASPAIASSPYTSSSAHITTAAQPQPGTAFRHSPHFIPNSQIKRSSSSDEEDDDCEFQRPAKVCATTDRVAAKLGHLNISSHGPVAAASSVQIEELEEDDSVPQSDPLIRFSSVMQTVMSHDSADLVSNFLQQELDKSSKAVVLWTPNPITFPIPIIETVDSDDSEEVPDSLSIDSDGLVIEEVVDDDDDGQMEVEL